MHPDTVKKIRAMVAYIKEYQVEFGTSPSQVEISKHLGVAPSLSHRLIKSAVEMKLIAHHYGKRRQIEVLA